MSSIRISWLSILILAVACGSVRRQETVAKLNEAESSMNTQPDSALLILESVDSTALRTHRLQARHSLLYTMALDKCYLDITTPDLLVAAERYYSHRGTADERMKTCYYRGRIEQDKGNVEAAAVAFARAESFSKDAEDTHAKGLLFLAFGSIYNTVFDYHQELRYKQKGLDILKEANDPLYEVSLGELALVYHSLQQWTVADSLYKRALEHAHKHAKEGLLPNYAKMKLLLPEPDADSAIQLLKQKMEISNSALTPEEAGIYAYAAELLDKQSLADGLIKRLEALPLEQKARALSWLYRIAVHRKDHEAALHMLVDARSEERKAIDRALSDKVSLALQEYYDSVAEQERRDRIQVIQWAFIVLLLLLFFYTWLLIRKRKVTAERDRLFEMKSALVAEMNALEQQVTDISGELEEATRNLRGEQERNEEQCQVLDSQSKQMDELLVKLKSAQDDYNQEKLKRYRQLGRLGSTIWQRERKRMAETDAWQELKDNISFIHQLQKGGVELVRRMDKELDGVISRMRHDLGLRGKPKEVLFLCCCILGVDPVVISDALELSMENVYKKRSRYRSKFEHLGKEEYLLLLRRGTH